MMILLRIFDILFNQKQGNCLDYTIRSCVSLSFPSSASYDFFMIRIDNGGLGYMCTWFCIFSDILAIHQSILTYYISD